LEPTCVSAPVPGVIANTVMLPTSPFATYRYWPEGSMASAVRSELLAPDAVYTA
jgi:hypothetical protein